MSWFEALVLGAVQGISEFLPISSSAHLVLVPWVFGWKDPGMAFDIFLHLGTAAALILYFFIDLWGIFMAGLKSIIERRIGFEVERMLFWWIVLGTIPAVIVGLIFGDWIEANLRSPLLVAFFLAAAGFLMFWIDSRYPSGRSIEEMKGSDSIAIGLAQALALIPGVSRSGSTISMARLLGFNRHAAARFSFLLSVPVVLGALALEGRKVIGQLGGEMSVGYLVTGFLASFIVGILSIHVLLQFLKHASLRGFAWYRLLVAFLIVGLSLIYGK
jgi:undecaprenyl-diphosphatase